MSDMTEAEIRAIGGTIFGIDLLLDGHLIRFAKEVLAARSTPKQGEAEGWESRAELAEQQVVSLSEERDFMREKLSQEQADAREIRRMLCAAYAGSAAYMDDGEAQDNREHPCIDFLRMSPPAIMAAMQARALKAAAPSPSVEPAPPPQQVEPGWVMVPAKPTQEMCQAGQWKAKEWPTFPLRISPIYQAMLAAAPKEPKP